LIPVELPLACNLNEAISLILQLVVVVSQSCNAWIGYVPIRLTVRREVGVLVLGHVLVRVKNLVLFIEVVCLICIKAADAERLASEDIVLVAKTAQFKFKAQVTSQNWIRHHAWI
jgi:hypothetical protein